MADQADTRRTLLLLGLAAACYLPLIALGYGANSDSARIAEVGRVFMATGVYTPSRYPGFPVHEIPAALLSHVGGATLANAGTLVMALVAIHSFLGLLAHYGLPHRTLLTVGLIGNPVFWTSATYTIDYVWSLALLLVGFNLVRRERYVWGCVALGLATGSRASSLGFAAALLAYQALTVPEHRIRIAKSVPVVLLLGAAAYAPTIYEQGILRLYFGDWSSADYVANFVQGNLFLAGPLALCVLVAIAASGKLTDGVPREWRPLALLCGAILIGYEVLFLWMPIQVGYLLPALPAVLLLLGIALRHRPRLLLAWIALSVSSSILSVSPLSVTGSVHRVDSSLPPLSETHAVTLRSRSSATSLGVFVTWGYVVADAAARIQYENPRRE